MIRSFVVSVLFVVAIVLTGIITASDDKLISIELSENAPSYMFNDIPFDVFKKIIDISDYATKLNMRGVNKTLSTALVFSYKDLISDIAINKPCQSKDLWGARGVVLLQNNQCELQDCIFCYKKSCTGLELFFNVLGVDKILTVIDLSFRKIDSGDIACLGAALEINKTLTYLNLSNNNMKDQGIVVFSNALKSNRTLTYLNLGNNCLIYAHADVFGDILKSNKTLTHLNLSNNIINSWSVGKLCAVLTINETLTHLDLSNNTIGDGGLDALRDTLRINKTLTYLNVSDNYFSGQGFIILEQIKKENPKLNLVFCANYSGE
jgi:Leucine Rich repeat